MSARRKGWKWFGRRNDKSTKFPRGTRKLQRLCLEVLEDRTLPAITVGFPTTPAWTSLGPTALLSGQNEGLFNQQNPVTGAVTAFAAAPNNSNVVFAATANGGIWETQNFNATTTVDVNQINNSNLTPGPNAGLMQANGVAGTVVPTGTMPAAGTVTYVVTFVDTTGVESNASQAVSFTLPNGTTMVTLTKVPTGPSFGGVMSSYSTASRNVYRLVTPINGTAPYYGLVGTINDNTTTTFTDNLPTVPAITTERSETVPAPNWVPLTDNFPTLAMSALTIDPDSSVGIGSYVVYAGTGNVSSSFQGGAGQGLLVSINGGQNWALLSSNLLSGVTITGIQVGARQGKARTVDLSTDNGIFLVNIPDITNPSSGYTITQPAGLPLNQNYSDLAAVPAAAAGVANVSVGNAVLFTALTPGAASAGVVMPGIYLSIDGGNTWSLISACLRTGYDLSTATRIRFAVYSSSAQGKFALYAGVIKSLATGGTGLDAIFRYDNFAGKSGWTMCTQSPIDLQVNQGGQGNLQFSMAVDPSNKYNIYVGGDIQRQTNAQSVVGNSDSTGQIYSLNTAQTPAVFNPVTAAYAPGPGAGPPPGAAGTAATATAPSLPKGAKVVFPANVQYGYAISYVDSAGEESARYAITATTPSTGAASIILNNLTADVPSNARTIKIYRTMAPTNGPIGQFLFLTAQTLTSLNASGGTYTDTTPDTGLGAPQPQYLGQAGTTVPFPTFSSGAFQPSFQPLTQNLPPGQGLTPNTTYNYEFVFINNQGQPSDPSAVFTKTTGGFINTKGFNIKLSGYLSATQPYCLIYRTGANDSTFRLVGVVSSTTPSFTDTAPDSQRGPAIYKIGTAPHADDRAMGFIGATLIESDDGGIYSLTNPDSTFGTAPAYWQSLVGNLDDFETYSTAYDPLGNVAIAGNQDNGSMFESASGSQTWTAVLLGDGAARWSPSSTRTT